MTRAAWPPARAQPSGISSGKEKRALLKPRFLTALTLVVLLGVAGAVQAAVVTVSSVSELRSAVLAAQSGDIIELTDGVYSWNDNTTLVRFTDTSGITVRSQSGNRDAVVLQGQGINSSTEFHFKLTRADYITIENLTMKDVYWHCVQVNEGSDHFTVRNCVMWDAGEGPIKSTVLAGLTGPFSDYGLVEDCVIGYTTTGMRSVVEGIDLIAGLGWVVRNTEFYNVIKVPAPAYGCFAKAASYDTVIENCYAENCDVSYSFGGGGSPVSLHRNEDPAEHYGGIVRNNVVHTTTGDVAVYFNAADDFKIYNNTFWTVNGFSSIDIRFASSNGDIVNNLCTDGYRFRDGATGTVSTNIWNADASYFVDQPNADYHLVSTATNAIDQGTDTTADVPTDMDGDTRPFGSAVDIGADEYVPRDCEVAARDLPDALRWDGGYAASITYRNTGAADWTPTGSYQVASDDGSDRWGLTSIALNTSVTIGATHQFDFTITAPPITTLAYSPATTPTAVGAVDSMPCNWQMFQASTPLAGGLLEQDVVIGRFPDVGQSVVGRFYIEECAGRVPPIVKGYPLGTYGPTLTVSREQMAIFMARALNLPLLAYEGTFTDVAADMVGAQYIEALERADIVQGFTATVYGPAGIVTREQMAIYVARGMAGGDADVPSGPAVANFPDVATSADSYKYVEYCFANEVAGGYPNGTYGPTVSVTREQMAIFIWRGFIRPSGSAVVLGGPAMTDVQPDPAVVGYLGWTSQHTDPQYAYVVIDAVRLGANLVYPATPIGTWDVEFQVRAASDPQGAAVASTTASLDATDIQNAIAAAASADDPYLVAYWDLSGETIGPGDYILVVLVEDDTGTMHEVGWKPVEASYVDRFFGFTVS